MSSKIHSDLTYSIAERIKKAKISFTVRRVDFTQCKGISTVHTPSVGDVLLARIERIGQHKRIELVNGRKAKLFIGTEVIVSYGNRYAPDQFEAKVPKMLSPCHLVAAGGIAAQMITKHSKMKKPTLLYPIGLLTDKFGNPINLLQFRLGNLSSIGTHPPTIAVVGTSMNAGKTTTAASLIRGLTLKGLRVGAAKITGTGAGGDLWFMKDSGADPVFDFVDAGVPSTYLIPIEQVLNIMDTLTSHLTGAGVDVIVLEIADGLYQKETAKLLSSKVFKQKVDGLFFAAGEAMACIEGIEWLQSLNIPILGISGPITNIPLAVKEIRERVSIPILSKDILSSHDVGRYLNSWFWEKTSEKYGNFLTAASS